MNILSSATLLLLLSVTYFDSRSQSSTLFTPYRIKVDEGIIIEAEIGKLKVPENHLGLNRNTIELNFVKLKSRSNHPGPPILYLAGGPGVSGISMLKTERIILFEWLRNVGDVIILDQRGTGSTTPILTSARSLALPLDRAIDDPESMSVYYERMKKMVDKLNKEKIDIQAYNTLQNSYDIEAVRKALNADKVVLWGYSYGSHLALAYLKYFPGKTERVILTGVNGLDQRYRMPTDANTIIETIDSLVLHEPKLANAIPHFSELVMSVLKKLEVQPVVVNITVNEKTIPVFVGRKDVEVAITLNFGSTSFIRELPDIFYQAFKNNNFYRLAELIAKTVKTIPEGTPMLYSMHYASGVSSQRWRDIQDAEPHGIFRGAINFPFADENLKAIWNIEDLGDDFRSSFRTDVPALLVSGNLDGRTSVSDANQVKKTFTNATHVVINNVSHDFLTPHFYTALRDFMNGSLNRDTIYTDTDFDFYSLNSSALILKLSTLLKIDGVESFKKFYSELNSSESIYLNKTIILPVAYQFLRSGEPKLALEALQIHQTIIDGENWSIYSALGDTYKALGDNIMARTCYQKSLKLNPMCFGAWKFLRKNKENITSQK